MKTAAMPVQQFPVQVVYPSVYLPQEGMEVYLLFLAGRRDEGGNVEIVEQEGFPCADVPMNVETPQNGHGCGREDQRSCRRAAAGPSIPALVLVLIIGFQMPHVRVVVVPAKRHLHMHHLPCRAMLRPIKQECSSPYLPIEQLIQRDKFAAGLTQCGEVLV